ncbi:DUF1905 domain-containing protein [Pseudactinotalea suaedae]|uniref:DUF1905 domain-containing protein n=1 Tax=Pseudactinotalea suaedae TaxID=1524924 RepID=UPI0012E21ECF|nr:DUF1905 domain-containing protein [Pseudactinotalea suaedae]
MAEIVFAAEVFEWRGPAPFYFMAVPERESERLRAMSPTLTYGWGMIPVTARISTHSWTTSLWPKDGGYVLPLKVRARQAAGLALGDVATATLLTEGDDTGVDRDMLIALVARLRAQEAQTEEQEEAWLREFAAHVPHPRAVDLVLYPEVEVDEHATAEQIVDAALRYRAPDR